MLCAELWYFGGRECVGNVDINISAEIGNAHMTLSLFILSGITQLCWACGHFGNFEKKYIVGAGHKIMVAGMGLIASHISSSEVAQK